MAHPLAQYLAPLMDQDLDELRAIVARWVVEAPTELERNRYRLFGAELGAVQRRIQARSTPPTQEEIEIALLVVLAISGRQVASAG